MKTLSMILLAKVTMEIVLMLTENKREPRKIYCVCRRTGGSEARPDIVLPWCTVLNQFIRPPPNIRFTPHLP